MDDFQEKFNEAIKNYAIQNQYGVSLIPYHTHNGTDSPLIAGAGTSSSGIFARAYKSASTQTISDQVNTKVTLDAETFDTNNNFASSRFTATVAGYYHVDASVGWLIAIDTKFYATHIFKNGSIYSTGEASSGGNIDLITHTSDIVYLNIGDYIELYCYQASGINQTANSGSNGTYLSITSI